MKKRLKKKVLKQMAAKLERMQETKIHENPSELEKRVGKSLLDKRMSDFNKRELQDGTLFDSDFKGRFFDNIREINRTLSPEGLREQAKRL